MVAIRRGRHFFLLRHSPFFFSPPPVSLSISEKPPFKHDFLPLRLGDRAHLRYRVPGTFIAAAAAAGAGPKKRTRDLLQAPFVFLLRSSSSTGLALLTMDPFSFFFTTNSLFSSPLYPTGQRPVQPGSKELSLWWIGLRK